VDLIFKLKFQFNRYDLRDHKSLKIAIHFNLTFAPDVAPDILDLMDLLLDDGGSSLVDFNFFFPFTFPFSRFSILNSLSFGIFSNFWDAIVSDFLYLGRFSLRFCMLWNILGLLTFGLGFGKYIPASFSGVGE
jgi:hypothetical protein